MAGSMALSRLLGMLRDTAMTAAFGVSIQTDAYNLSVLIPDLLFMLIAGGGLSSAFMPVFSEFLHTNREKQAWKFFSVVVTFCSLAVLGLIALAWVFAPGVAHLIAADKTDKAGHNIAAQIEPLLVQMGRILLPAQFAFLIGSVLIGTLYSRKQFAAPALAPNVYNVGIILGALIGGHSSLGIVGLPIGGLIGAMIGNLLLPVLFMVKAGSHYTPSLDLKTEGVRKFFVLLAPVILGFSLPSVVQMITMFFAAQYPAGINTALKLGNNLMQAPNGIFGQALALAAFPVLTQFFATKEMDKYRDQLSRTLRTVIYLGIPSAAMMLALAPQIVQLLYGYGRAAHEGNLGEVVNAVRVYSICVFAWCVQPVLMRGFFSIHKTLQPILLSTAMTALFIAMCFFCIGQRLPYLSLAWATDIAAVLLVIILFVALEASVGSLDRKGMIVTTAKALAGGIPMAVAAFAAFFLLSKVGLGHSRVINALAFVVVSIGAMWVYYFVTRALGMPETAYFDRALSRLRRRGASA